jgi:hypothetical protein
MSKNKTVSNKTTAVATGLVLATSILVALSFQPGVASAQEVERKERLERELDRLEEKREARLGFHGVIGTGVATDQESGQDYRSGFRFLLQKVNGTDSEFEVRRGVIGIFVDSERVYHTVVPETWSVLLSDDGLSFEARGKVEQGSESYDVNLMGSFGMHTCMGTLWAIHGEMEGRDSQYDLRYVGMSHGVRLQIVEEFR